MTVDELIESRKSWGWNQTEMAEAIGLSLRAYQDIENGRAELRKIHVLAFERVALSHAARILSISVAPESVTNDAIRLAGAWRAHSEYEGSRKPAT